MNPPVNYPLTIYYDAACPLCRAEMHALLRHDHAARLKLIDCSSDAFVDPDASAAGMQRTAMLSRIHARDADGQWLIGVPVFEAAYHAVGIAALARVFGSQRLAPLLARSYGWVADHRQGLSKLGVNRIFGWIVERLAARVQRRALQCRIEDGDGGACSAGPPSSVADGRER